MRVDERMNFHVELSYNRERIHAPTCTATVQKHTEALPKQIPIQYIFRRLFAVRKEQRRGTKIQIICFVVLQKCRLIFYDSSHSVSQFIFSSTYVFTFLEEVIHPHPYN